MLWNWGHAMKIITALQHEAADAQLLLVAAHNPLGAQNMSGMPHSGGISDSTADTAFKAMNCADKYADLLKHLENEISIRVKLRYKVDKMLQGLTALEQLILRARYQDGKTWSAIAREFNYSETQVRNIERDAINKLKE